MLKAISQILAHYLLIMMEEVHTGGDEALWGAV